MSKNQQTFRKSEIAKSKLKKKQDKVKKKEERKDNNNKGKSLEEQFVYVDFLGRLTNTPPEKQRDLNTNKGDESDFVSGKIKFMDDAKKFGFVSITSTGEDVYFRYDDLTKVVKKDEVILFKYKKASRGLTLTEMMFI